MFTLYRVGVKTVWKSYWIAFLFIHYNTDLCLVLTSDNAMIQSQKWYVKYGISFYNVIFLVYRLNGVICTKWCDLHLNWFYLQFKHKFLSFECSSDVWFLSRLWQTDFYSLLELTLLELGFFGSVKVWTRHFYSRSISLDRDVLRTGKVLVYVQICLRER